MTTISRSRVEVLAADGAAVAAPATREEERAMARELLKAWSKIANLRLHIENPDRCTEHGSLRCIECEKRCESCGDDGTMSQRHGQRLCENCAWDHDHGEDDCGWECSEIPEPLLRLHRTIGKCGTFCSKPKESLGESERRGEDPR